MKVGVLFSGGKDSTYALSKVMESENVVCLITIISKNKESYMFHTPNVNITKLQADVIGLPLVVKETEGVKEEELVELKDAIVEAMKKYGVEGIATGAVESVYQTSRVQKICDDLGLWCFNPLWKKDQLKLVKDISNEMEVIISGVFAPPLDEKYLGKKIDSEMVIELEKLWDEYKISPTGEGGEIETTVLDADFFKKRIVVKKSVNQMDYNSGVFVIQKAEVVGK